MVLPCLSAKQPWASMIAGGSKTIETRTWPTSWRGPLAIAASRTPDPSFEDRLTSGLPYGQALCIVLLTDCRPMTAADEHDARCDYCEGAWAWRFQGRWPLVRFGVRGRLKLYDVTVLPGHLEGGRACYDELAAWFQTAWDAGVRWRPGL